MDWIEYLQFVINSIKNPQQSYMMPNSSAIENGLDTLMSTNSILDLLRMNSVNNSFGIEQQQQEQWNQLYSWNQQLTNPLAQHENPFSTAIQRSQQFLDASQNIAFSKESEKIECKVPANNHNVSETFLSTETNVGDQKPRTYENLRRLLEKTRDEEDCSSDDQFVDVESVDDGGDGQKPNFLVSAKTIPSPADCVSSELMDTVTTKSFGTEEQQLVSSANKNLFCLCKKSSSGDMIQCHNNSKCANGIWFHFECVNMVKAPKRRRRWYCPGCLANYHSAKINKKMMNSRTNKMI